MQSPASAQQPDLQALLGNLTGQQQPHHQGAYGYMPAQQQQPTGGYGYGAYGGLQQQSPAQPSFPQGIQIPLGGTAGGGSQNMQSVLDQIRWKQ